jgi:hypothetical protein
VHVSDHFTSGWREVARIAPVGIELRHFGDDDGCTALLRSDTREFPANSSLPATLR